MKTYPYPIKVNLFGNKYSYRLTTNSHKILNKIKKEFNKENINIKKGIYIEINKELPIIIPLKHKLSKSDIIQILVDRYSRERKIPIFNYQSWNKLKHSNKKTRKEAFKIYFKTSKFINKVIEDIKNPQKDKKININPNKYRTRKELKNYIKYREGIIKEDKKYIKKLKQELREKNKLH